MSANFNGSTTTTITIVDTVVDTIGIREGVHTLDIEFALSNDFNADNFLVEYRFNANGSWATSPTYALREDANGNLVKPFLFTSTNIAALTKNTSGFFSMSVHGFNAVRFKMALAGASSESGTVITYWQVR